MQIEILGHVFSIGIILNVSFILVFIVCAIEDIREQKIHIILFIVMSVFAVIDMMINRELVFLERGLGALFGCSFLLLSKVTRKQIGWGDGCLITILGMYIGIFRLMELVLYGMLLAAMVSILLLVIKKVDKKKKIAFVPFLFVAYMVCLYTGGA